MKFEEEEKEQTQLLKYVGWVVLIIFGVFLFFAERADAAITVTPTYDVTSGYLTGATASVEFDGTGYIQIINPDGEYCSMDQPGWNGFGTQDVGVGTALDTSYFPGAFSTCVPAFATPDFWTPDGEYIFNLYTDPYDVGLYDTGIFCQGAGCTPPPTPTPTSTPTSTAPMAPYIPFLGGILFFFSFWTMLGLMLWTRK